VRVGFNGKTSDLSVAIIIYEEFMCSIEGYDVNYINLSFDNLDSVQINVFYFYSGVFIKSTPSISYCFIRISEGLHAS